MFDDELEKQPEFDGFVDLFESFKLRRGKKETEEEEEDARVVGIFKVPPSTTPSMFQNILQNKSQKALKCTVWIGTHRQKRISGN